MSDSWKQERITSAALVLSNLDDVHLEMLSVAMMNYSATWNEYASRPASTEVQRAWACGAAELLEAIELAMDA